MVGSLVHLLLLLPGATALRSRLGRPAAGSASAPPLAVSSQAPSAAWQPPAAADTAAPLLRRWRTNPLARLRGTWASRLSASSGDLWQAVYSECDTDADGFIDRRELIVLLYRLGVTVPSEASLKALFVQYDIDENDKLDFDEFCSLVRDLDDKSFAPARLAETGVGATREFLDEQRKVVLWRDIFDSLDRLPSNGYLELDEIGEAFERVGVPVTSSLLERQLSKYDANADGRLSFQEYSRMATDVISSYVLYERAMQAASTRFDNYDDAAGRAEAGSRWAADRRRRRDAELAKDLEAAGNDEDAQARVQSQKIAAIEEDMRNAFGKSGFGAEALGVLRVQDGLYRRFKRKYGRDVGVDDSLTAERVLLLDAIQAGDTDTIRALTNIDWNFVYPPAMIDSVNGGRKLEGWCRSPLCLLVRPDEGNFQPFMRGVSDADLQALLEDVLASGCADPNFPPIYWGNPAMHACFEGNVAALEALRQAGCNLRGRFEWLLQDEPQFSLAHAAAFNGQLAVLEYLRNYLPPSFFREVDAEGSSPLHTLLDSSRDMDTARFLLTVGVDGFALNKLRRSPLSMAIETLPELALELLQSKSRFEYRWWGKDLYWYSFSGIVLPLASGAALPRAGPTSARSSGRGEGRGTPLQPLTVSDQDGKPVTIEDLILRHDRKELLETPVMLDLIERKWRYFAGEQYNVRITTFAAMLAAVFVQSVCEPGTPLFYTAVASTGATWGLFGKETVSRLRAKFDRQQLTQQAASAGGLVAAGFFDVLDVYNLAMVPIVSMYLVATDLGLLGSDASGGGDAALAVLSGVLQVTLSLSMLNLVSLFRVLGPLLITVVQMLSDSFRFATVIGIVILGYANGFYSLIHFGVTSEYLASLDFDYSYSSITTEMCLWLSGQPDQRLIEPLAPNVQFGAQLLFWSFIVTSYFVLLNLLIAIFNTTYDRILSNSMAEWLFIRLRTTVEFEAEPSKIEGVQAYYEQLQARDNQRAVRSLEVLTDEQGTAIGNGGSSSAMVDAPGK